MPSSSWQSQQYVYGGLGWISGTPGTIRNTANPVNTLVGPFADWPMPFETNSQRPGPNYQTFPWSDAVWQIAQEQQWKGGMGSMGGMSGGMSGGMGGMNGEEVAPRSEEEKPDPTEIWKEEKPGQFLVGGYSSNHTGGANFFFGDGSVRFLSSGLDLEVFHNLGNRADGNVVAIP